MVHTAAYNYHVTPVESRSKRRTSLLPVGGELPIMAILERNDAG